jgi:hypothetical protein
MKESLKNEKDKTDSKTVDEQLIQNIEKSIKVKK